VLIVGIQFACTYIKFYSYNTTAPFILQQQQHHLIISTLLKSIVMALGAFGGVVVTLLGGLLINFAVRFYNRRRLFKGLVSD
jgi:hypothetical protein